MNISTTIRQARIDKGISQAEMARRLNIRRTTLMDAENGRSNTGKDIIEKICNYLGLELIKKTE